MKKSRFSEIQIRASRSDEGGSRKKIARPSQRRELAEKAVAQRGVSIALAYRTFGVSETCYRYSPQRSADNERIADLLLGLVKVKNASGFGLCILHLCNVQAHRRNHKRVYRVYRELELNPRTGLIDD